MPGEEEMETTGKGERERERLESPRGITISTAKTPMRTVCLEIGNTLGH